MPRLSFAAIMDEDGILLDPFQTDDIFGYYLVVTGIVVINFVVGGFDLIPVKGVEDILIRQEQPHLVFNDKRLQAGESNLLPERGEVDQENAGVEIAFGIRSLQPQIIQHPHIAGGKNMFRSHEGAVLKIGPVEFGYRIDDYDIRIKIEYAIEGFRKAQMSQEPEIHFLGIMPRRGQVFEDCIFYVYVDGDQGLTLGGGKAVQLVKLILGNIGIHEIYGEIFAGVVDKH